jgi:hypothetical protein
MFGAIKHLIPQPHAHMDGEQRYNLGLTWIDREGLTDHHNLQIKYIRNSEKLAVTNGEPQPDGSWKYIESGGMIHTMSAERVNAFFKKTQENAVMMSAMIDKITEASTADTIDTEAATA